VGEGRVRGGIEIQNLKIKMQNENLKLKI